MSTLIRILLGGAILTACEQSGSVDPTEQGQTESFALSETDLGKEISVGRHLADGEEFDLSVRALLRHGETLFSAVWTPQEGGGRPLTKGTGNPVSDPSSPLVFPRSFNRLSAPDANSCASCHITPRLGGGGHFTTNAFLPGHRFDFLTFDHADTFSLRGVIDESGAPATFLTAGDFRSTTGMFGSGYVEMLARQMTTELQAQRDGIAPGGSFELVAKGISFGTLSRTLDGAWDVSLVEGLPMVSLATSGADAAPSLIVQPFHASANVVSLRQFSNNAFNHHHGVQSTERFGAGVDPDGDGFFDEMTRADITAVTIFQATLPVPGRVIPRHRLLEETVWNGEVLFEQIGCASCHVPTLPLTDSGWIFAEPNPFNPPGNLRPGDAETFSLDLNDPTLPRPRLSAQAGVVQVPAYTDLKLHDITTGPDDPNVAPIDFGATAGSPEFFAGNRRFLTKKLWGVASEPPHFHHGKFTTLREAIQAHAGEAQDVTDDFNALTEREQNAIIEFLKTLQILPAGTNSLVVDERGNPRQWPPQL